jgi:hypothetical protein
LEKIRFMVDGQFKKELGTTNEVGCFALTERRFLNALTQGGAMLALGCNISGLQPDLF